MKKKTPPNISASVSYTYATKPSYGAKNHYLRTTILSLYLAAAPNK
jgi:hypothetical protein